MASLVSDNESERSTLTYIAKPAEVHVKREKENDKNIFKYLITNQEEEIVVNKVLVEDIQWGESLAFLPIFTRSEIDNHVGKCGKLKSKPIAKTLIRGRKLRMKGICHQTIYIF